jgi:hypothetical protein
MRHGKLRPARANVASFSEKHFLSFDLSETSCLLEAYDVWFACFFSGETDLLNALS